MKSLKIFMQLLFLAIAFNLFGQVEVTRIDTINNIPVFAVEWTSQDTLFETNYYFEENGYIRYYACSHPGGNISVFPGIRYETKKHNLQIGDIWNSWSGGASISEVVDILNISTPYGDFLTAKVTKTDSISKEITRISYYSEDVGLIKTEYLDLSFTIELSDYTIIGSNGYFPLYVGNYWNYSINTSVSDNKLIMPHEIVALKRNYPNPFNPSTTIEFSIQNDSNVELSIFNIQGQKIKTLVNEHMGGGYHSVIWNGDDKSNKPVSSGVYLYKLNINDKTETAKKCLLLK